MNKSIIDTEYVGFNGEKTQWHGFSRYDFLMDEETLAITPFVAAPDEGNGVRGGIEGQLRCVVVVPASASTGTRAWSWQGCYFDHEPQAEVELLHRGFHIAYIMADPGRHWEAWYAFLTEEHGLSTRPAFVGMSKGAYNAFEWATTNPDKVSCIYADNPAISRESIGRLGPLIKNDVPLLHVCGSLDPLLGGHTFVVETIYHHLGGRISVMIKEGAGHHPHSLHDPKIIADFMVASVEKSEDKPAFPGEHSSFYAVDSQYRNFPEEGTYITCRGPLFSPCYDKFQFNLDNVQGQITAIVPQTAAEGKPWVFRADLVTRDAVVDLALLAHGYHIVTGPVVYNGPGPIREHWDIVYRYFVDQGLSEKPVMEGVGGAAGEAYAWAIANADKVSAIYAENPVMRATMTSESPTDNLFPLAEAGIPLLHVCGALDPWLDDHTRVVEARYRDLGGKIAVIIKDGIGHYPVGPIDLKPVLDFILGSR